MCAEHNVDLGDPLADSPFEQALVACHRVMFALDATASLFKRSWCLYELVRTIQERKQIDFVTIDGLVNKAQQLSDANMKVIHCLCNVMPEEAEASAPSDKDMIDKLVEAMPGGVEYMKVVIRGMVSLVYRMGGQSLNFVDPISQQVSL